MSEGRDVELIEMFLWPAIFKEDHLEGVDFISLVDIHNVHAIVDFLERSLHSLSILLHGLLHVFLPLSLQLLPLLLLKLPIEELQQVSL